MSWTHLVRFESNGEIYYGNARLEPAGDITSIVDLVKSGKLEATIIQGDVLSDNYHITNDVTKVTKLLPPLTRDQVPIIRCIGLNYIKHIQEGGRTPPPYPSLFIKPSTSMASFDADITIPKLAQETLDYEGELTIVIGRPALDINEESALEHVAGYIAGNDLSCRVWQKDPKHAGHVPQWCFSKGFNGFAPVGPMVVSPNVLGAADNLSLRTIVNGEVRQDGNTSDLLFGVRKIVSFLSQGTTLETGTLIMTGTPAGVAMGMKPPRYLRDGDVVTVEIENLGSVTNVMRFV